MKAQILAFALIFLLLFADLSSRKTVFLFDWVYSGCQRWTCLGTESCRWTLRSTAVSSEFGQASRALPFSFLQTFVCASTKRFNLIYFNLLFHYLISRYLWLVTRSLSSQASSGTDRHRKFYVDPSFQLDWEGRSSPRNWSRCCWPAATLSGMKLAC